MITREDVKYVANLSRIHIPEDQLDGFAKDLAGIVSYVDELQKLDVSQVKPTSHAVPLSDALRDDVPHVSFDNAKALSTAIESKDGCFKVPLVIE